MSSGVEIYQSRYGPSLATTEKVAIGRHIIRVARLVAPRIAELVNQVYTYVRILDDATDETPQILPVIRLLREERQALLGKTSPTELQLQYLSDLSVQLPHRQQERIIHHITSIVTGLAVDANIRYSQKPLTDRQLQVRNYLDLWPEVMALSIGLTGREPNSATPQIRTLMHAWGSYDNLSDLTEDLKNGLVLINQEDMQDEGLYFQTGEVLPNDKLQKYYQRKRWPIIRSLRENSSAILKVGLPTWIAVLAYLYFHRTQLKLLKPLHLEPNAVYNPPLDAKVNS